MIKRMAQVALLISCGLSVVAKAQGIAPGDNFLFNNRPVRVSAVNGAVVRLTSGTLVFDTDLTRAQRLTAKPSLNFFVRRPVEKLDVSGTVDIFRIKNEMWTQGGRLVAFEVAGNGILNADFITRDEMTPQDLIRTPDAIFHVISNVSQNDFVELSFGSFELMVKESAAQKSYDTVIRMLTLLKARGNFAGTQIAAYADLI